MLRRQRPDVAGGTEPGPVVHDEAHGRHAAFDSGATDPVALQAEVEGWVSRPRPLLGDVLLGRGAITADELSGALRAQQESGERLGQLLSVDETLLADGLASQFKIRVADLRVERPEQAALDRVGEQLARRHQVLPLSVDTDERCWVVMADPLDREAIVALTAQCGRIGLLVGTPTDIARALDQEYDALSDASIHIQAFQLTDAGNVDAAEVASFVDENAPIVQVVNRIITQGVRNRSSDIHIEAQERVVRVRYRIDGALFDAIELPLRMGPAISSRIKVMAELNIVERRRPQDGQFSINVDGRPIDVRTSVVATIHGEKIVMRLLDKQRSLIGLGDLGMPEAMIPPYLEIVQAPLGMLLCTGPTGSGKTTTLYATLTEVNDTTKNVVTIEDPVEYHFDGVNQMQVSEAAGISFAEGLRGVLRQDPDVILVGEIRDVETARIATQASLTGHLVLSSLHAVDAVSALHRFTDMGIEPFLVASAINGVVGQRLLRRICDRCVVEQAPSLDQQRLVERAIGRRPGSWRVGAGCEMCNHTGYRGRIGVYELLQMTDTMRTLIVDRASAAQMRQAAVDEGMHTMQEGAFELVAEGVTTVEEVLRSVYAPTMSSVVPESAPAPANVTTLETGR